MKPSELMAAAGAYLDEMPMNTVARAQFADAHLRHMIKLAMCGFAADTVKATLDELARQMAGPDGAP